MTGLKSLHIKRFKAIKDAPFDLDSINLFVGANNSGKSSIIQALHFGIGLLQTVTLVGRWTTKKGGKAKASVDPSQLIYSPTEVVTSLCNGTPLKESGDPILIKMGLEDGELCEISIEKGRNRNIIVGVDDLILAKKMSSLEQPFSIFSPGLSGVAKSEQYVSDGVLLRTIARGDANLVLRNIMYRIWEGGKKDDLIEDLREIFPEIDLGVTGFPRLNGV